MLLTNLQDRSQGLWVIEPNKVERSEPSIVRAYTVRIDDQRNHVAFLTGVPETVKVRYGREWVEKRK